MQQQVATHADEWRAADAAVPCDPLSDILSYVSDALDLLENRAECLEEADVGELGEDVETATCTLRFNYVDYASTVLGLQRAVHELGLRVRAH